MRVKTSSLLSLKLVFIYFRWRLFAAVTSSGNARSLGLVASNYARRSPSVRG